MNAKKKKLLLLLIEFVVGMGVLYGIICYIQRKEAKQAHEHFAAYSGVWEDEEGNVQVEIHQITAKNIVMNITFLESDTEISLMSANATALEKYEFLYNFTEEEMEQEALKELGGERNLYGVLYIYNERINVQFSELWDSEDLCIENKKANQQNMGLIDGPFEFTGDLHKIGELDKEELHLMDYMGTKKEVPEKFLEYCTFERDDEGTIWRIQAAYEEDVEEQYGVDLCGISRTSTVYECEKAFGKPAYEEEYWENSLSKKRNVYFDDNYRYSVNYTNRGTVAQIDVCRNRGEGYVWKDNDFLMKGDTVVRYLGNYSAEERIDFPEGTKRVATNAFYTTELDYYNNRRAGKKIFIPKDVTIEKNAFAHCASLTFYFEAGRKTIEKESFAHMISLDECTEKLSWVTINLPTSVEVLENSAFALGGKQDNFGQYLKKIEESMESYAMSMLKPLERAVPVVIVYNGKLKEIGENALWGCGHEGATTKMQEIGKCINTSI